MSFRCYCEDCNEQWTSSEEDRQCPYCDSEFVSIHIQNKKKQLDSNED